MGIECVCCDGRVDPKYRRPFHGIAMRPFVSVRKNISLPNSGSICGACRMCYLKWRNNAEFAHMLDSVEKEANEVMDDGQNDNDDENKKLLIETSSNDLTDINTLNLPLNVTISSHQECSVCRVILDTESSTISEKDRDLLFIQSNIFIPKGSRCCPKHIINGRLRVDALNKIRPFKIIQTSFSSTDVMIWFDKFRNHYSSTRFFDFDSPFAMLDIDCYNLTGITKLNFDHLAELLKNSNIKSSSNRSVRNAIGLFLTKLRLGISNKVVATIFQFSNPQAVSRTLASVRQAMLSNFVPHYLGFNHLSRQDVIHNHSSSLAT